VWYNQLFDEIKEEQTKPSFLYLETHLMEELQTEDKEDGMRRIKCQKVDNKKPFTLAQNELWIEEEQCSMAMTNSDSFMLPPGLQDLGENPGELP
jgi:hypothetical protein